MRMKNSLLLLLFLFGLTFQVVEAQVGYREPLTTNNAKKTISHIVKVGDTVYSIATNYNTTVDEIYKLNRGSDKGIKVGQVLLVPNNVEQKVQSTYVSYEDSKLQEHKIAPKETLFSVSQKYGVTKEDLQRANPGLSEKNFSISRVIVIPQIGKQTIGREEVVNQSSSMSVLAHKVQKKETLYSLSKKYNCTEEDIERANPGIKQTGLKEGYTILIPIKGSASGYNGNSDDIALRRIDAFAPSVYQPQDGIVRIALLLPFIKGSKNLSAEKINEYYEGFLLAVHKMKEQGLNAEIYTFDIGDDKDTRRLESILGTNELNSLHLVIGGVSEKQVELISHFSERTGIKYVVPFNNKGTGIAYNPHEFQVANAHSTLFPKITRAFAQRFNGSNIIFLAENGSDNNKKDFVKTLQAELDNAGISYKKAPTTASLTGDLGVVLDANKKNIIIPASHSENSLVKMLDALDVLTKENELAISLFGYPEWQTYTNQSRRLHRYDSYIYSMFFLDTHNVEARKFSDKYTTWFNKRMLVTYPRFAHMGYDTGMIFMSALQRYGYDFAPRINDLNTPTLQSALYFEPIGERGGYINSGVYIVNLRPDNSVVKIELKK